MNVRSMMPRILLYSLPLALLVACAPEDAVSQSSDATAEATDLKILDANNDGALDPFEALDALVVVEKEIGRPPSMDDLRKFSAEQKTEALTEFKELIADFDANGNAVLELAEREGITDEQAAWFLGAMDANSDGAVTGDEAFEFDFESLALANEEEIRENLGELFAQNDADKNDEIDLTKEITDEELDRFLEFDLNRDKTVTRDEAYRYMKADNVPATFTVKDDIAYMEGVITAALPATVLRLLFEHPEVTTIEMSIVPGSIDDEANVRAALYVHEHNLATKLNAYSAIASGGTDFFLAGTTRTVEDGATIGVHSWGGPVTATEIPRDDPAHQIYLDYYEAIGIPAEFYWYTLEAAPAEDIHLMTEEEMDLYHVRTQSTAP